MCLCLNTITRLTMLCLSGFELCSRWVPLFLLRIEVVIERVVLQQI